MNLYFSGIGGVAIGPLSEIALDAGYSVQGSDIHDSLTIKELLRRNIPLSIGPQDGQFLRQQHTIRPIDLLIYTSALPPDHPELVVAKSLGIKVVKRDELIAKIIKDKDLKLIAIAGTHGKTTTTGMMIWVLEQLRVPISYSIGTTLSFGPSGKYDPKSQYFIYEADEFDRNFLHFSPFLSIIASIDYDHPDTYKTEDDYLSAFHQFAEKSNKIILWQADAGRLPEISAKHFELAEDQVLPLALLGEHNRRNGTLVLKALEDLGIDDSSTNQTIIVTFPGTKRRFEKLADNLYSDYAHHPAEIKATLQLASELKKPIIAVYQPHQNIRQHHVKDEYKDAFSLAEKVYWLPTYLSREDKNLPSLSPKELISYLANPSIAIPSYLSDKLWLDLKRDQQSNKTIILMGAGDIDDWARSCLKKGLRKNTSD